MRVNEVIELCEKYGKNTTLEQLRKKIQGNKIHKCPKCDGKGTVSVRYNAYPLGLPDSGWVEDWRYKDIICDLCNGEGYTENEFKPKMVQEGWEEVK